MVRLVALCAPETRCPGPPVRAGRRDWGKVGAQLPARSMLVLSHAGPGLLCARPFPGVPSRSGLSPAWPARGLGDGGRALSIGTGRQRALLALLVLRANELVASDRLVEELWGESPPPTAHKMLQNQVSALRQSAWSERAARDSGQRLPAECRPRGAGCRPLRGACGAGPGRAEADPERRGRDAPAGARPLARAAALRPCLRAVCADRDRPLGGAALGGVRGARRGRARARPARGSGLGARGRRGRAAASGAPARPADARPVPLRPAGRGARGLPQRAPHAGRGDRRRAGHGAASAAGRDPRAGPRARCAAPARRSCRRRSMAARRCWRAGIGSWPS